jgi:hypothetical protein
VVGAVDSMKAWWALLICRRRALLLHPCIRYTCIIAVCSLYRRQIEEEQSQRASVGITVAAGWNPAVVVCHRRPDLALDPGSHRAGPAHRRPRLVLDRGAAVPLAEGRRCSAGCCAGGTCCTPREQPPPRRDS